MPMSVAQRLPFFSPERAVLVLWKKKHGLAPPFSESWQNKRGADSEEEEDEKNENHGVGITLYKYTKLELHGQYTKM